MNIIEVAKTAGVSKSTVSRVLNKHSNVKRETADAVMEAIRKLGYKPELGRRRGRPSKATSGLRTGTVAMFFPDTDAGAMDTPLSVRVSAGVEKALYEDKLSLMLAHFRDPETLPPCFIRRQIDGAIVRAGYLSTNILSQLSKFPCVWIFQPTDMTIPFDLVMPDNQTIGELCLQAVIRHGSTHPFLLNFYDQHGGMCARTNAAASAAHIGNENLTIINGPDSLAEFTEAMDGEVKPDGLVIPGGDEETFTTLKHLLELGISVGDHFPVVTCVNDIAQLRLLAPAAINVDINAHEIGRSAVELLLWRLRNPKKTARRILIAPLLQEG